MYIVYNDASFLFLFPNMVNTQDGLSIAILCPYPIGFREPAGNSPARLRHDWMNKVVMVFKRKTQCTIWCISPHLDSIVFCVCMSITLCNPSAISSATVHFQGSSTSPVLELQHSRIPLRILRSCANPKPRDLCFVLLDQHPPQTLPLQTGLWKNNSKEEMRENDVQYTILHTQAYKRKHSITPKTGFQNQEHQDTVSKRTDLNGVLFPRRTVLKGG